MKSETLGFVSGAVLLALVVVGFVVVKPALAQVGTSTDPVIEETSSSEPAAPTTTESTTQEATAPASEQVASSTDASSLTTTVSTTAEPTPPVAEQSLASPEATQTATRSAQMPSEARPEGLTEVRIIGTKYIDYFTDGINTYTFPGDPQTHAHIAERDAPIPKHEGLTWVHSTGQYLYDTPSGDLEVGQYALQPNGTYIQKGLPFVSATSSPLSSGSSTAATGTEVVTPTDEASSTSSSTQ